MDEPDLDEMLIDELARRAGVPVRTIREYQTLGLLPSPEKRGRVALYRRPHLMRLDLVARLQARGYSLAAIRDLVDSWRDGADLADVLGLAPDELIHIDEPGRPATPEQLHRLLPGLVPSRFDDLVRVGVIEACGPNRYCVPSPSLLQLVIDALEAGLPADAVLELVRVMRAATQSIADEVLRTLKTSPSADTSALAARGRGLLAHATGRLTIHALGKGLTEADQSDPAIRELTRGIAR